MEEAFVAGFAALEECRPHSEHPKGAQLGFTVGIDGSGRVDGIVLVKDEIGEASLRRCARERIQGWRFPAVRDSEVRSISVVVKFDEEGRASVEQESAPVPVPVPAPASADGRGTDEHAGAPKKRSRISSPDLKDPFKRDPPSKSGDGSGTLVNPFAP
jgi:hypothetical protein